MNEAVNSKKVKGRRVLRFESLEQVLAEVEMLEKCEEVRTLGNWSAGQTFSHLARAMVASIDGFPGSLPWPLRVIGRVIKGRALRSRMRAGFKMPKIIRSTMLPPEQSVAEGAAELREAIGRLGREKKRAPSPLLGELTVDQWEQFHCRHAELHLGFLVPGQGALVGSSVKD